jgi:hypothetical protein
MKKFLYVFVFLSIALAACGPAAPTASPTPIETPTISTASTPALTAAATLGPTPSFPPEGYGPSNFPSDVDPLTGLTVANPALLERRPMVIKVSNQPRYVRPQWGLSLADIVFEYFTDDYGTRFAVVFYGNDAEMVGPIRSGRLIDVHLVRGYKAIFAFVSADLAIWDRFLDSEFADRLVSEGSNSPIKRYDPNGFNHAVVNTADLSAFATSKGIQNGRQSLDGMFFKLEAPTAGQPGTQAIVRYSSSIYNRWDYDPTTGKYLRFSDTAEDYNAGQSEQYAQLTDRLTNQPIAFDNMVVLFVTHEVYSTDSKGNKITDILFSGSGDAYAFRDGQVYQVKWQRNDTDVVSLTNPDGTPFPFKPGTTWFEVMGVNSTVQQTDQGWRFTHQMP